jgi:hypothetical protein
MRDIDRNIAGNIAPPVRPSSGLEVNGDYTLGFSELRTADLRVVEVGLDDQRLTDLFAQHVAATVFQHPAWLRVLAAEYDQPAVVLGCETAAGRLVASLPLVYTRGFPLRLGGELVKARLSSLPRTPIA